ncbi:3-hydroxyisobutyrate dehydrogenase [Oleiphilus messinensis]|uniref:3-hydroxyisobutyrate dehydrogenase n=1 Tax=Oleiphilus messinensis TaxID=141451 RepID=A0A1Y0IGP1_9GAMM|nr:NAD(P)-dependent oxidoreductase [Oleiphilus messinensis]ARU59470.1 3-hydroxyisobutyrate dehydrogenase [Oleiphilus messinensis]
MTNIAFLGLGAMGSRMVRHLIAADHSVTVWNRTHDATKPLAESGAVAAETPADAARHAEVVISMVRDDEASREVWLNEQTGALKTLPKGAIAIESSTLTPAWIEELAIACKLVGIEFADAPVAGSRPQAEAAKLIYLVGAEGSTFAHIKPLLLQMGGAVHHTGTIGTGARIKLAVNALFGVQVGVVAELLGLLKKSGMDLQQAHEIIGSTPVCSPAAKLAGDAMIAGQFAPAFPIELVDKDFGYVRSLAVGSGCDMPLIDCTYQVLQRAISTGLADKNITAIAQLYMEAES